MPKLIKLLLLLIALTGAYQLLTTRVFGETSPQQLTVESLVSKLEEKELGFSKTIAGNRISFFNQRRIGEAVVEKDFINYQFDDKATTLLKKRTHWRTDLPVELPPVNVSREQAVAMAEGTVQSAQLVFISPESDVFPIKPTPEDPCWVVTTSNDDVQQITIINAASGNILGYGIPPPSQGFSLSGPIYFSPCSDTWSGWYKNAERWFEKMDYPTDAIEWPTESQMQTHIENRETALFYELAHGWSESFCSGCLPSGDWCTETSYSAIKTWMANREKMFFAFIGSCDGMCETISSASLSYQFRKGSNINTATVGYCGMSSGKCSNCWLDSISWQDALFNYISQDHAVKLAFEEALADYPNCGAPNNCMRFAGDPDYKIGEPHAKRGDLNNDGLVNTKDLKILVKNYLKSIFDLNSDQIINGLDFGEVLKLIE